MIQALRAIDSVLITPTAMTAAQTASATKDISGSDWVTIRIPFKTEINTSAVGPTVSVLTSDTTDATNYATITADRVEDLTAGHELRYEIDGKTAKRYLKLSVSTATHTTNDLVTLAAIVSLTRNAADPASTTAMQGSTNDVVVIV